MAECSGSGCGRTIGDHKWGRIKNPEWFQQRDGRFWCPDHLPAWLVEWRAAKAAAAAAKEES